MPEFLSRQELAAYGGDLEAHRGRILKERYLPLMTAFPGVRDLFQRLIADGRQVALASSAKEDELTHYKKVANIYDLIDAETSSDDAERSKPHPDIFQAVLERLPDLNPARAIVIGDTPWDAEAASKVGLRMIGLMCGGWEEDELRRSAATAASPYTRIRQICLRNTTGPRSASSHAKASPGADAHSGVGSCGKC